MVINFKVCVNTNLHGIKTCNQLAHKSNYALTSPAVRAFLRARAASSADLAAELVISNNAASKFRMRSAAADNLFPLVFLEDNDEGDLDAMAVADRVGESVAVIFAR